MSEPRICLAAVVGPHGVRGLVRIKAFTEDPESVAAYGPLSDEAGARQYTLRLKGQVKGLLLAEVEGVRDRDAAEALRGLRLYVPRSALPPPEDPEEFYHADLIGLRVETAEGTDLGRVVAVQDFGAGDLLEIEGEDGSRSHLPFTRQVVPQVDLAAGRLVAEPPEAVTAASDDGTGTGQEGDGRA
ncbi:ribosome maturation factor RimM [Aquibaculum arenosum]|uniref:Ribosome maturation factor RimM n=1 Tax=Aquibaculum arenosum TaxID=3032591 RepID=A0ABT5YKH2_9PROT|nr:ribosome maturation factor RimM [Fodinicurvata sp. CAU 1616]MDF2095408.1 ribosome maturation factor RimM [Fodinicurvata sp. CAU 1616]